MGSKIPGTCYSGEKKGPCQEAYKQSSGVGKHPQMVAFSKLGNWQIQNNFNETSSKCMCFCKSDFQQQKTKPCQEACKQSSGVGKHPQMVPFSKFGNWQIQKNNNGNQSKINDFHRFLPIFLKEVAYSPYGGMIFVALHCVYQICLRVQSCVR